MFETSVESELISALEAQVLADESCLKWLRYAVTARDGAEFALARSRAEHALRERFACVPRVEEIASQYSSGLWAVLRRLCGSRWKTSEGKLDAMNSPMSTSVPSALASHRDRHVCRLSTHSSIGDASHRSPRLCARSSPLASAKHSREPTPEDVLPKRVNSYDARFAPFWGITLQQLLDFRSDVIGKLDEYCSCHESIHENGELMHICMSSNCRHDHYDIPSMTANDTKGPFVSVIPNMHAVVGREVKPRTKDRNCSYALMLNPDGLKADVFVSHTWTENFNEFVDTLQMALNRSDSIWVCSFALNQNGDIKSLLNVDDVRHAPFAVALKQSKKLLVTLDTDFTVPSRAWCAFEIVLACHLHKAVSVWFFEIPDFDLIMKKVKHVDLSKATASNNDDLQRIRTSIEQHGGFANANATLSEILLDRLAFHRAMLAQGNYKPSGDLEQDRTSLAAQEKKLSDMKKDLEFEHFQLNVQMKAAKDGGDASRVAELDKHLQHAVENAEAIEEYRAKSYRDHLSNMAALVSDRDKQLAGCKLRLATLQKRQDRDNSETYDKLNKVKTLEENLKAKDEEIKRLKTELEDEVTWNTGQENMRRYAASRRSQTGALARTH